MEKLYFLKLKQLILAEKLANPSIDRPTSNNGRKPKASSEIGKQVLDLPGVTRVRSGEGSRPYVYRGIGLSRSIPYRHALPSPEVPESIARRMTGQAPSNN